jgi:hypothetical protein
MLRKIDEIIEFSELGDFIYQPLRTYSSGMHVRLGFSVAVHVDPEILVVDEALAVGDLNFQDKCLRKMREFRESGATIIIVSHGMSAIAKLCDRAAWLDAGAVMAVGDPKDVITKYLRHIGQEDSFTFEEEPPGDAGFPGEVPPPEVETVTPLPGPALDALIPAGGIAQGEQGKDPLGLPEHPVSWWESSTVMNQCEAFITGSPEVSLQDFLRRYIPQPLEKGLSVCLKLKGLGTVFMVCDTCRAFDVIGEENKIADILRGDADFGENQYDLFLCTDLLHRVSKIDLFLMSVERALTKKGFVVAIEYVGPQDSAPSEKEVGIAESLFRMLNGRGALSPFPVVAGPAEPAAAHGVSSERVIPALGTVFDVVEVRFFGGALHDLVLNRALQKFGSGGEKDSAVIKTIMFFERILMEEGLVGKHYALILAKKRQPRGKSLAFLTE